MDNQETAWAQRCCLTKKSIHIIKIRWDLKPIYIYTENTNTWKDGLDTETGPCASYLQFFNSCYASVQESFLKSSDGVSLLSHLLNLVSRAIAENDI